MGLFNKNKNVKVKKSRFYLVACQMTNDNGSKPMKLSYIFNKENGEFEKKDFADLNMIYKEHVSDSKEELVEIIQKSFTCSKNNAKEKSMKNFLQNSISIGIVEEYIHESEDSLTIKTRFYPLKYISPKTNKGKIIQSAQLIIEKGR